jgi:hypothetical protein
MAFDLAHNRVVLFGGKDPTGAPLGDHWSWNGTAWSQQSPALLPPARHSHGLAFDANPLPPRNRIVCYGGTDASGRRDDVWEWDGANWTNVTPIGTWGPGARDQFAMTYDARAERVVVFGGEAAYCCSADAWSWNGQAWTLHVVAAGGSPGARHGTQMVHDSVANQLLLFGGECGTQLTNDLWSIVMPVYCRSNAYDNGNLTTCPNSNGPTPLSVVPGSCAILGQTLQMQIDNVPVFFSFVYGVLGLNRHTINGFSLPFQLNLLGLPGCFALTSSEFNVGLGTTTTGRVPWPLPIPTAAHLLGTEVFAQALVTAPPPTVNPWASLSNALTIRLGNQ